MNSSTNDLIELVIEELAEAEALELASGLLKRPVPPRSNEDETLDEELPALAISDDIVIRRPHVRLLCYGNSLYDLEINFAVSDIEDSVRSCFAERLQAFATKLTGATDFATFFAGLEPASDEDTRIFTGQQLGPLLLD